jgi:hypothetical protein
MTVHSLTALDASIVGASALGAVSSPPMLHLARELHRSLRFVWQQKLTTVMKLSARHPHWQGPSQGYRMGGFASSGRRSGDVHGSL